ncbi:hypothetical protein [Pengzhenrongella sicca]|uniref:Uncharacterized protein n=1 Tax=Pengzhenrongella sicca TaxID=2819238 RepID=A0A8A4ZHE3_9MICO|nr:hypothetical protein [Pengzhenrongella sicca]QTE29946.1 hypothetical protein J4E96_02665 [Pengzhenrongella sicca]
MNILFDCVLVLHLIGWAIVLGGTLTSLRAPRIAPGVLHGALTALVTGVVLVALKQGGAGHGDVSLAKMGVKLAITLVITGLVVVGTRSPEPVSRRLVGAIAGLTVVNVAIAVAW